MDQILHQLGQLLLRAVPTFLLVVVLHFYLKSCSSSPWGRCCEQRYEATEGARKLADESLERAAPEDRRIRSRHARGARRSLPGAGAVSQAIAGARSRGTGEGPAARRGRSSRKPRRQLARDVEAAKAGLAQESELLADQIAECHSAPERRMKRLAIVVLIAGWSLAASAQLSAPPEPRNAPRKSRSQGEQASLEAWKWANFLLLAGGLGYLIGKNAGPFFAAARRQIRKDMLDAEAAAPGGREARRRSGPPPGQPGSRNRRPARRIAEGSRGRNRAHARSTPPPKSPRSRPTPSRKSPPPERPPAWN